MVPLQMGIVSQISFGYVMYLSRPVSDDDGEPVAPDAAHGSPTTDDAGGQTSAADPDGMSLPLASGSASVRLPGKRPR